MIIGAMSRRWRTVLAAAAACVVLAAAGLVLVTAVIRSGIERTSAEAVRRFPGDPVQALIATVECERCALKDRNRSVWALGQTVATPALPTLQRYYTGAACRHDERLCQHELRKAIRMIEAREGRRGFLWQVIAAMHRPS